MRVRIGGVTKRELQERLAAAGVLQNDHARALFAWDEFRTADVPRTVDVVTLPVAELGCPDGATMPELIRRAGSAGLAPAPLELGPHLRLELLDQLEGARGRDATAGRAPPGSLTVISAPVAESDAFPKGFYLRRIEGVPWLRGYCSDDAHVWSAGDVLVFAAR